MKAIKVLIITDNLGVGGRERRLVELLKGFSTVQDIEVTLVVLKGSIGFPQVYTLKNTRVLHVKRRIKKDPSIFLKIHSICREFKPSLIHVLGSMAAIYALPIAVICRIHLINAMVSDSFCPRWSRIWWRSRLTFPFSDIVLSNSFAGIKAYNVPQKKAAVIHNGFDFSRTLDLQDVNTIRGSFGINTPYVVGMVGTFHPRKDYETFFSAALEIIQIRKDISFISVGEGENLEYFSQKLSGKYSDRIIFAGKQNKVESIINVFDVGVLTSNHHIHAEGISNSILEYMALGKPVIVTKGGGTDELVEDGVTGYIIEPASLNDLVDKIIFLIDNPESAREMGRKGKQRVMNDFNIGKMVNATLALYHRVISH